MRATSRPPPPPRPTHLALAVARPSPVPFAFAEEVPERRSGRFPAPARLASEWPDALSSPLPVVDLLDEADLLTEAAPTRGETRRTSHDRAALVEIDAWKNPPGGSARAESPRAARDTSEGAADACGRLAAELRTILRYDAAWTPPLASVGAACGEGGFECVPTLDELHSLPLERLAPAASALRAHYRIAASRLAFDEHDDDVAASALLLAALCLKSATACATLHGLDVRLDAERNFVLGVLGVAAATGAEPRRQALAQLATVDDAPEGPEARFVTATRATATTLARRLVAPDLRRRFPVGAALGFQMHVWFVVNTVETALVLCRERFLVAQYGKGVAVPVHDARTPTSRPPT